MKIRKSKIWVVAILSVATLLFSPGVLAEESVDLGSSSGNCVQTGACATGVEVLYDGSGGSSYQGNGFDAQEDGSYNDTGDEEKPSPAS